MMNTKSPSNSVNELNVFSQKIIKLFLPPPHFLSEIRRHCALRAKDKPGSFPFTLKCVLVCFALVFFVFAGNTYAQQTVTCDTHSPSNPPTDKDALIALYCATDGDNWTNKTGWLTDAGLNMWHGVYVASPGDPVTELTLHDNNLTGTIPPELRNLTSLTLLWLRENNLTGAIPPELGSLTNLGYLQLQQNQLTGAIPSALGNLTSLADLYLYENQLTGAIPSALGNLTSLTNLYLENNQLTGSIPSSLGNLTSLTQLYLYENKLTGAIPSELGNLTALTHLRLENNKLTGGIPDLSALTSLEFLWLHNNQLTGAIPSELGDLAALRRLRLANNKLTGTIPSELGNLTALQWLLLNDNELTGEIPDLSALTSLVLLYLQDNDLEGPVPTQIESLFGESLSRLPLWGNQFSLETLSDELVKMVEKTALSLFYAFSGGDDWTNKDGWNSSSTVSHWHGVETDSDGRVTELNLADNNLTGEIFDSLRGLARLEELYLYENQLSGAIPPKLGNLTSLQQLHLDQNQLSGAIPPELGNLTGLEVLDLSGNELSCDIPDLSPLSQLSQLWLQNNYQLGGTLSESLADSLQLLNINCTSIPPGDLPDSILVVDPADCMGTVEAACPSPAVSPVDTGDPVVDTGDPVVDTGDPVVDTGDPVVDTGDPVVDTGDPVVDTGDPVVDTGDPVVDTGDPEDQMPPTESPQGDEGGGCAIAPNAGAGETSQGIAFDLILVMSALLVISWRNHSAAKKT